MKKHTTPRKLRDRMGSNTHQPGSPEEAVEDGTSDAAEGGSTPLAGAHDEGVATAERLKAGSRKVA